MTKQYQLIGYGNKTMLQQQIKKLAQKQSLNTEEAEDAMRIILEEANDSQIAAFLALLHAKGENANEIIGFVNAIKNKMTPVCTDDNHVVLDVVGTGGDGTNSVNISTITAIALASLDIKVAKHGNRSASSKCGSADLIEALQLPIDLDHNHVSNALNQLGFSFLFAPNFHPALKRVKQIRKDLKIKTVFNLLGPLLNPATPTHSIIGVYDEKLMPLFAELACQLNINNALIVHSCGTDEISCLGETKVIKVNHQQKKSYTIHPNDVGLATCTLDCLEGGSPQKNKELLLEALKGKDGGIKDTIILNMAIALKLVGKCSTLKSATKLAKEQINSGKALDYLVSLQNHYRKEASTNA